jgi:signal transduction histidine kinase
MKLPSNVLAKAWQRYLVAIALTVAVVVGRLALNPWWGVQQNRHLVLLPTVMLAAWLGGFRAGVLSALLSTLALQLLWSKTPGLLHVPRVDEVLFLGLGVVVCGLVSSLQAARSRADSATHSRERVLEIVAHDLRSPLTAIKALGESMAHANPGLRPRLEMIDRAVGRMDRLIGQLVDATRIGHGELSVTTRPEPVGSMVAEAVDLYAQTARERKIVLEATDLPAAALVQADRDRVMQVLGNLVGNALKFTSPGGRVTLSARPRSDDGQGVLFSVADTGTGIEATDLPHVFEQYWKHDKQGTGLGLFIARGVVQAHHGRIWVESKPKVGTTFFFTLPVASPSPAGSLDAAQASAPPEGAADGPAGAVPPTPVAPAQTRLG